MDYNRLEWIGMDYNRLEWIGMDSKIVMDYNGL
jgi:hypothetical protein